MNIEKIAKFAEKGKYKKLIQLIDGKKIDLAIAAAKVLPAIKNDETYNCLVRHIRDSDKNLRIAVATALGDMGNDRGKAHLLHMVEHDSDPDVVAAAKAAAAKL